MRREDLFEAIGMVDDGRLNRCEQQRNPAQAREIAEADMAQKGVGKAGRVKWVIMIAAVIVIMTGLMGSAIAAYVSMRSEEVMLIVHGPQKQPGESGLQGNSSEVTKGPAETHPGEWVYFEEVQDTFMELDSVYPQQIPEGYHITFVSEGAPYQSQEIVFSNDAGQEIRFMICIGSPASVVEIYDILEKTEVKINGQEGFLYQQTGNYRTLVWIDKTMGFGFSLRTGDSSVDLIAMAESTAKGEYLTPTRSESTILAMAELGDFQPGYLPEGFVEQGTLGSPLAEGGGWYSYVRKWFVNREENKRVFFEYESYRVVTENGFSYDPTSACATFMPRNPMGEIIGEKTEINGLPGYMLEEEIAWADPDRHIVYHLYSEDVTGEALLEVAKSIYEKQ